MAEIRQIVVLSWIPISRRDAEWLQFDLMEKNGFIVKIFDLSLVLQSQEVLSVLDSHKTNAKYVHQIESYAQLNEEVKKVVNDSIFIDLLQGIGEIQWRFEKVFRILKKHNARYCVMQTDGYPTLPLTGRQNWIRFKKVFQPKALMHFIARKIAAPFRKKGFFYPLPVKVFGTRTNRFKAFIDEYEIPEKNILTLNHPDYYDWLNYSEQKEEFIKSTDLPPRYCVFVDDAQTHHPDYAIMNLKPLDNAKYLASMNKLFRFIENKTGMPVVIAGHPRPQYDKVLGIFDGRRIIQGKTLALVANSELTIVSYSTAASFAVLFNKPLMIVTNDELLKVGRVGFDEPIARSLGLAVVNADDDESLNRLNFDFEQWPKTLYQKYIYDWLKFRDDDLPVVQVLINGFLDMNKEHAN